MEKIIPFIVGCLCGIKDSFLGLILLRNIDNDDVAKEQEEPPSGRSLRSRPDSKYV